VVKHLDMLPRELVDASLKTFKGQVGRVSEQPDLVLDVPAHFRWGWSR